MNLQARTLGEALGLLRHRAQISIVELEERTGISKGTLWNLETGRTRHPNQDTVKAVLAVLATEVGADLEDLWLEILHLPPSG
jgi:transcriptional regulator with XRE-family HTH domain